jgi:hypothetical protein
LKFLDELPLALASGELDDKAKALAKLYFLTSSWL